jgi:hypothetical protein
VRKPHEPRGLAVLAEAMKSRMDYLGLTIADVGVRGGPQRGAMREILNARRMPRRSTLHEIDTVLGWPKGVAYEVLHEQRPAPEADEWLDLPDENRLGLMRSHLLQMRKDHQRLSRVLEQQGDAIAELLELIDDERQ